MLKINKFILEIDFNSDISYKLIKYIKKHKLILISVILICLSAISFIYYLNNNLGLAYNDARSHLDIGRRVVEGLKPGLAQLGSVWLPLTHILMIPTIWNDFMWHSGLSGALQSMVAYVATSVIIFYYLKKLGVSGFASLVGMLVFAFNLNVLYLQSTAMTELLLIATMTAGAYELLLWYEKEKLTDLILTGFWVMLSTLIRYDGWFLLLISTAFIGLYALKKYNFTTAKGMVIMFSVLGGFGVVLWFIWNLLIFKDPFYFAYGPYSAHTQQLQLEQAGVLVTKHNLMLSIKIYLYSIMYNAGILPFALSVIGYLLFLIDKKIKPRIKIVSFALISPFVFNIVALYFGHSVLFIQGLSGNSWFNVRYGVMVLPAIAVFIGYLIHRAFNFRYLITGLLIMVMTISFMNHDAVTLDDALYGASGKNVKEVSGWLKNNVTNKDGFVLISVASHDAIIFSSGLPMSRFIHEGTGLYWYKATTNPDIWARWIIMRTYDNNDLTFKLLNKPIFKNKYHLVDSYPFADIYEINPQYVQNLYTKPILGKQK